MFLLKLLGILNCFNCTFHSSALHGLDMDRNLIMDMDGHGQEKELFFTVLQKEGVENATPNIYLRRRVIF